MTTRGRVAVAATGEQALAAGLGGRRRRRQRRRRGDGRGVRRAGDRAGHGQPRRGRLRLGVAGRRRPGRRRRQRRDARPRGALRGLRRGVREVVHRVRRRRDDARRRGSVATPGIVPAFGVAHERFARLPWARLLRPAAEAARTGYPMSPAASRYLAFTADSLFAEDAEAHALVTRPAAGCCAAASRPRNPAARRRARRARQPRARAVPRGRGRALRWSTQWPTAGWSRRPTSRRTSPSCAMPTAPSAAGRGDQPPPAVGGPVLARDAGRAGAAGRLDLERRDRDAARGAGLPARRARLLRRPRRRRARAAGGRRRARARRAAVALDRAHLRRRRRTAPPARSR